MMNPKIWLFVFMWSWHIGTLCAQTRPSSETFSHADSLRGSLRPERTAYDVLFYDLNVTVDPVSQRLDGQNTIRYRVVQPLRRMQIDLFANMDVTSITQGGKALPYTRDENALFVTLTDRQPVGKVREITVVFGGKPRVAVKPPWDGGFVWKQSPTGKPWVAVACEGIGASLWWPCKDHLSDEPDSMRIRCRVPRGLTCVANGTLVGEEPVGINQTQWTWHVHYPINSYNVSLNIADYAHLHDTYQSADKQTLALDYYVLAGNESKAKPHFEQVKGMLACYERYFGKFPFWRDGYKLVETPYWGMEHQTAVAYGNNYKNNPFGFDFIIIHESGHEYFGNSLSCPDHAEMWIHEAFTTYAETLYMECTQTQQRSIDYLNVQRKLIKNQYPMLGPLGVNYDAKDTDIYYKGTWMLHTLRHMLADDTRWFRMLKELCTQKRLSIVNTNEVIDFMSRSTGTQLRPVMTEYLTNPALPTLEYVYDSTRSQLRCRWLANTDGFNLPVRVRLGTGTWQTVRPTRQWQTLPLRKEAGPLAFGLDYGLFAVKPSSES